MDPDVADVCGPQGKVGVFAIGAAVRRRSTADARKHGEQPDERGQEGKHPSSVTAGGRDLSAPLDGTGGKHRDGSVAACHLRHRRYE